MSIADTSQGMKDVTAEYRAKGILPPASDVDPEAPTPKTKLPWLVKSATFDQLSLTLALLEEQGYTPTLISPGGMIPDTRPGGGLMWCSSAYTVCGKLKEPTRSDGDYLRTFVELLGQGRVVPIDPTKPIPENTRLAAPRNHPALRQTTEEEKTEGTILPPSLPVPPKGKGKK